MQLGQLTKSKKPKFFGKKLMKWPQRWLGMGGKKKNDENVDFSPWDHCTIFPFYAHYGLSGQQKLLHFGSQ